MQEQNVGFTMRVYDSASELNKQDATLMAQASKAALNAYAPYSNFRVGAAARMQNGSIVTGSNQENASFPVGLCAERVLLGAVASQYPGMPIESIAITYSSGTGVSDHPVAPCGICRQSLQEYEHRTRSNIRMVLGGQSGKVIVIDNASSLLPLAFSGEEL
jgi:cytidine deaminase